MRSRGMESGLLKVTEKTCSSSGIQWEMSELQPRALITR